MLQLPLLVTAAIICKDSRILLARRKATSRIEAGKWEFPGGKLEFLEHPEACLIREIKEELDIEIAIDRLFALNSHVYTDVNGEPLHIILAAYLCHWVSGTISHLDVADTTWVYPHELDQYEIVAGDQAFVQMLKDQATKAD